MKNEIIIYDTTLRDGEQAPGFTMTIEEKVSIAEQLEKLGVNVLEAGFPVSSPGDFEAVEQISKVIKNVEVSVLARANENDVDQAWHAVSKAVNPRLHVFVPSSDIQILHQLQSDKDTVLKKTRMALKRAQRYTANVQFSAMDATRSDPNFLVQLFKTALDAGASILNLSDTVGCALPSEFAERIIFIKESLRNYGDFTLSVHCHDDLGVSTANTLMAIEAGARQVECTMNGIGERAGNAALEEVAVAILVRGDRLGCTSTIKHDELLRTSRLLSAITGVNVPPNKSVVGKNAFAHESGIHQDGIIKFAPTYEFIDPSLLGLKTNLVIGKHSGRRAINGHLKEMGYSLNDHELEVVSRKIKNLADFKKHVYDTDLHNLIQELRSTDRVENE